MKYPENFDDRLEKTLNRAGLAAALLSLLAVLTLAIVLAEGIATAWVSGFVEGMVVLRVRWIMAAALMYGIAVLINVQSTILVETWRQGNAERSSGQEAQVQ